MLPNSRNPWAASQATPPNSAGSTKAIHTPQANAAKRPVPNGPRRSSSETSLPIHTTG